MGNSGDGRAEKRREIVGEKGGIIGVPQYAGARVEKAGQLAGDTDNAAAVTVAAMVAEIRAIRMVRTGRVRFDRLLRKPDGLLPIQVMWRYVGGDILKLLVTIIESHCGLEKYQRNQQIAYSSGVDHRGITFGDWLKLTLAKRPPLLKPAAVDRRNASDLGRMAAQRPKN